MPDWPVKLVGPCGRLEALYQAGAGVPDHGVVLVHPHPLYGGDMHNNVVICLQQTFSNRGWSTLRFNFRGVGASDGRHGAGTGEIEDLRAAVEYLATAGCQKIHWAGYSFGAWIVLKAAADHPVAPASLVLISPPVNLLDFGGLSLPSVPALITVGERDDFCAQEALGGWIEAIRTSSEDLEVVRIPGCDHFYWGCESTLARHVTGFMNERFR
jgi:hypothetical protein